MTPQWLAIAVFISLIVSLSASIGLVWSLVKLLRRIRRSKKQITSKSGGNYVR